MKSHCIHTQYRSTVGMNGWTTNFEMIVWLYARLCVRDFLAYMHTCAYFILHIFPLYISFLRDTFLFQHKHTNCTRCSKNIHIQLILLTQTMCYKFAYCFYVLLHLNCWHFWSGFFVRWFVRFSIAFIHCLSLVCRGFYADWTINNYLNMPSGTWKKRKMPKQMNDVMNNKSY